MEALDRKNRQSGILSIINHEKTDHNSSSQPYTSSTMATAIVSPTNSLSSSIYSNGPPPPYSHSWTAGPHSMANLISPSESRRTSDIKPGAPPPLQTTRQSLPSIHEALNSGHKPTTYTSPVSTSSLSTPHQTSFPQPPAPSTPRSYPPPDHAHYSHAPPQPRQPSPPQPLHAEPKSFSQPDPRPTTYVEAPRHHSITSLPPSGPHNPYAASRFEQARYEPEPRREERPSNGYSYIPPPTQQAAYTFGSNPPSASALSPTYNQARYSRDGRDMNESWKASREPEKQTEVAVRQGIKRHFEVWDFENTLSEVNVASSALHQWSEHYNAIAQEQQRSINALPDRMPTVDSVNDMIMQNDKIRVALDKMKDIIPSQQRSMMEQRAREMGGRPGEYDEEMSMYGDDMKSQGFGSNEGKKRRGRAAPPGRCHSCNRAETPEWRRGPDGARTLCNACGLHYAKLTRKNTMKQSQGSNGSSLRPKSLDDVPQRPL